MVGAETLYEPVHHGVLAVDIEGFGRRDRNNQIRVSMRAELHLALCNGLKQALIAEPDYTLTDKGDGFLAVFEPHVYKQRLIDIVLPRLIARLEDYNRDVEEDARMRLRAVVHAGELIRDEQGYVGADLNHAFRLLDSAVLRKRLARVDVPLILIVSEAIYNGVVKHTQSGADPSRYEPVRVTLKETKRARAWIWVPDRPSVAPAVPSSAAKPQPVSNLPAPNVRFTGRGAQLEGIHRTLTAKGRQRSIQALHGLPGVGKSQLAREYAHRHGSDYDVVWCIRAERPATILAGLAELARRLGLPDQVDRDQLVAQLVTELGKQDRWLLVFDNAAGPKDLRPYLPPRAHGHVLITTRNPAFGEIARPVKIDVLSANEARRFLLDRTASDDKDAAQRLAEKLGGLPLALEQAAAYVEQTGLALSEYLDLYGQHHHELLDRGEPADYGASVKATFGLAFGQVVGQSPAAAQLAGLCAFLAPTTIPHDLITRPSLLPEPLSSAARDPDDPAYIEIVGVLHRYSLAERDHEGFRIHQLVQAVIRGDLTQSQQESSAEQAVRLLDAAWPDDPQDPTTRPRCRQLLDHMIVATEYAQELEVAPDATVHLLRGAGIYHVEQPEPESARGELERALVIAEATYGPDDPEVALTLTHLSRALRHLGRLDEAKTRIERAVKIYEAAYGNDDPRVAWALTYLGATLRVLGDHSGAFRVLWRARDLHETAHGADSDKVAWALTHLSRVLRRVGDHAGAQVALERALAIDEAAHGPDDHRVAHVLIQLGRLLRRVGDHAGARVALERALLIEEAVFGSEHYWTAQTLTHLGALLRDRGDLTDAYAVLQRALAINKAVYGGNDYETAWTLTHLGRLLRRMGDYSAARAALDRALDITEGIRGSGHPQVAWVLTHLSTVMHAQGQLDEARTTLERALDITEATYGSQHPDVAWTLTHLSAIMHDLGQRDDASAMAHRALTIAKATYGTQHPDVAWTLTFIGSALQRGGQPEEAKPLLERALTITEAAYSAGHIQIAWTLIPLGRTLRDLGDLQLARAMLERAFAITSMRLGLEHPDTQAVEQDLHGLERRPAMVAGTRRKGGEQ